LLQISFLKDEGFEIFVKEEILQYMSSVKTRGVIYSAITIGGAETQGRHSNLNGQLRYYSLLLCKFNISVTVVMPKSTADKYVNMCRYSSSPITYEDDEDQECVLGNFAATVAI